MHERSLPEGSMDTSHSQALVSVFDRLKSVFEPPACAQSSTDLDRLLEALDDAYVRGELNGARQVAIGRAG